MSHFNLGVTHLLPEFDLLKIHEEWNKKWADEWDGLGECDTEG